MYTVEVFKATPRNYKNCFRLIIWETDPECGARTIVDIKEQEFDTVDQQMLHRCVDENDLTLSPIYDTFDFGRAKKLSTKLLKIIESMVEENA